MTRLIVVVEGQTEEAFVNSVLKPHLDPLGVYTSATIVGKRLAQRRGSGGRGGGHYRHWRRDIVKLLEPASPDCRVTTLFDLYGLPDDFPNYETIRQLPDRAARRGACEAALAEDVDHHRFIPYVQQFEFEALVLAALPALGNLLDDPVQQQGLATLTAEIGAVAPEDVNDGPETAPSKRLLAHVPGYNKVLHGELATLEAGLPTLRDACPGFDGWVTGLETLVTEADGDDG